MLSVSPTGDDEQYSRCPYRRGLASQEVGTAVDGSSLGEEDHSVMVHQS